MNSIAWTTEDAPHTKAFYCFVVVIGLLGCLAFLAIASSGSSEASGGWRIAYVAAAMLALSSALQAGERVVLPGSARIRSARLSETAHLYILLGRWVTLVVSLGGFAILSIVRYFGGPETRYVCEDLRILLFSLIFLCYLLADFSGERMFGGSMWPTAPEETAGDGGGLLRRRKRRSFY